MDENFRDQYNNPQPENANQYTENDQQGYTTQYSNPQPDYANQYAQYNQQTDYSNQSAQYNQQGYTQYNAPQNNYNNQYSNQNVDYNTIPYNYNQSYPQYEPTDNSGKGFSIASLVLGILSVLCCCCGIPTAVLGIVFGVLGRKKCPNDSGLATAGLIISIIGVVLCVVFWVYCLVTDSINSYYYNPYYDYI